MRASRSYWYPKPYKPESLSPLSPRRTVLLLILQFRFECSLRLHAVFFAVASNRPNREQAEARLDRQLQAKRPVPKAKWQENEAGKDDNLGVKAPDCKSGQVSQAFVASLTLSSCAVCG